MVRKSQPPESWKDAALRCFPEFAERLREEDTPYLLWFELWSVFKSAYRGQVNRDLIARIYRFADWCAQQPRGVTASDDLMTCVAVCFFEEIPTYPPARDDMPNWFTRAEFVDMRDIFRYKLGPEEFSRFEAELLKRAFRKHSRTHDHEHRRGPPRRK